ncbi:MAG: transcriptional regulator [Rhodothermales bacterium]|nr:transcriptional regulator [Rhodothermales bacterium]
MPDDQPAGSTDALCFRFGDFVLDVPDRQLWRGRQRIDLNTRYLDALVLLVRERNTLIEKDRFFEEVWTDVVVSDSALTQCIKEIRRVLDDDASDPRFVQTVPRHGYRFIADVERVEAAPSRHQAGARIGSWQFGLFEVLAGSLGGGAAGLLGGLIYGFGIASADAGVGTLSTLLVVTSLCVVAGVIGGFGVSAGLAGAGIASRAFPEMRVVLRVLGAAAGGLFIGSLAKLLGIDAFNLLFGRAPAGITGGPEGAVLGAALAAGAWTGQRIGRSTGRSSIRRAPLVAGLGGAFAGALIPLAGGRLMGGSLNLLAQSFADSNLQLDAFGPIFGELGFGLATQVALGGIEGFLFGLCVVAALGWMARMRNGEESSWSL